MTQSNQGSRSAIVIIGALFFIFGFVTWVNGVLIPYLKLACGLTDFQAYFVTFAFYISYFVTAIPSSWILKKTGLKNGMVLGLLVMALGALIFIPAAMYRTYPLFLVGLFTIGTGLSVLQTASNPYVTIVGPIESAAQRISIMGICNKIAGILAPLILGAIILNDIDPIVEQLKTADEATKTMLLDNLASRIILPYLGLAASLAVLGFLVKKSPLPEIDLEIQEDKSQEGVVKGSPFAFPNLVLGVVALFLYVGVEVMAGDTISNFGVSQGIPLSDSKTFTSLTLTGMVIGYVLGIICIPKIITQEKALSLSAILGIILTILAIVTKGFTAVACIAFLGLANALVWPVIWPLAIKGLGKFTKLGSAFLIMAISGGAILPLIYGALPDKQQAYWIMVPCYAFILFYSWKGAKIKAW